MSVNCVNDHPMLLIILIFALIGSLISCAQQENNDADEDGSDPKTDDDDASDDDDDDDNDDDDDDDDDTGDPENEDWRFLWDAQGRAMILRGCNLDGSAKGDSGLPAFSHEEVLALSGEWGFNFTRYLIFWFKIEPEPGVYDEAYLDEVETRLDWAAEAGLQVVLDMHQDLWGPGISDSWGGSDGAPQWATLTDDFPHIPFSQYLGSWAFDYLSPAVIRAFDNFWDYQRHPELQDHYAAMWAHVVERFRDHPAVLGYDPMNEPWQGTGIFHYREFDETLYSDFSQRMIDAIRAVDEVGWIFYEPCAFGPNQGLRSHMRILEDPRQGENRLAYFPHLYPVLIDLAGGYMPQIDQTVQRWEKARKDESEAQRAPLLSGEWAMLTWFDNENRNTWYKMTLQMMERVTVGWAFWDCGWLRRDADQEYFPLVTSAYPRRVAGFPLLYHYEIDSKTLILEFENRPGVTGPTEIFIPAQRDYPQGWEVEVSDPDGSWSSEWDEQNNVLSIETDPEQMIHTIRILPANL